MTRDSNLSLDPRIRYFWKTFYRVPFLTPFWDDRDRALLTRFAVSPVRAGRDESCRQLEEALARVGYPHVVLTSTGRFALEVGLRSLGRPGTEVIVPTLACNALADAVVRAGCVPVFADVNDDLTMSAASVHANVTPRTSAVIVAHMSGKPVTDMDDIASLCRDRGIALVDDAAQALGVTRAGRPLGTFGDFGILSFGVGKATFSLGGGALIVRSAAAREACARMAAALAEPEPSLMSQRRQVIDFVLQYACRRQTLPLFAATRAARRAVRVTASRRPRAGWMTAIEAQMQLLQLEKLDEITRRFRTNGRLVVESLPSSGAVRAPQAVPDCGFTKLLLQTRDADTRALQTHLLRHGIEIEPWYRPLEDLPRYAQFQRLTNVRGRQVWRQVLAVPVHPGLTPDQVERVRAAIASFGA